MRHKQPLTDVAIKAVEVPSSGAVTVYDSVIPGLGIRVSQGGTRSFIVKYGQRRLLKTLGQYPATSLKMARRDAAVFLATANPNPTRTSVSQAISAFLEHSERNNRPRTTADYRRLLARHFPTGKLSELSKQNLLLKLSQLAATPGEQSHAHTAFKVFLNWCVASGYLDQNPLMSVRGIGRIKKRDRVLSRDELRAVLSHAMEYPYPFGNIVALLICTGQRVGEIGKLHGTYIAEDTITLPKELTKNKRGHTFPFGGFTRQFLPEDEVLFPGRSDGYFRGYSKSKAEFDQGLNDVEPYTLHDLRRTFASLHAEIGTPPHVIERLLNHISGPTFGGIAGIYNRHTYLPEMREACDRYEAHLRSLVA